MLSNKKVIFFIFRISERILSTDIAKTITTARIIYGAAIIVMTSIPETPMILPAASKQALAVSKLLLTVLPIPGMADPERNFPVLYIRVSVPPAAKPFMDISPRTSAARPDITYISSFLKPVRSRPDFSLPAVPDTIPYERTIFMQGTRTALFIKEKIYIQSKAAAPYTVDKVRFPDRTHTAAKIGTKAFTKTDISPFPDIQ